MKIGIRTYHYDSENCHTVYYLLIMRDDDARNDTQFGLPMFSKKEVENALKLLGIDPIGII